MQSLATLFNTSRCRSVNGEDLKQSLKFKQKFDNFNYGLTISGAQLTDTGLYTVTATNSFGRTSFDVKVNVERKPPLFLMHNSW